MVVSEDIYKQDVDFTTLALQFAEFATRLKSNGHLDFSDPESVRQLTKALLRRDFDLQLDLPANRLCPPVPNRFNYIIFLQKLVENTQFDYHEQTSSDERVLGLDIGTGASAIYPLLACRQRSNWFFLATEIDVQSREYALRNVKTNKLQSRIKVIPPDAHPGGMNEEGTPAMILPVSQYTQFDDYAIKFQMTNPPFYTSEQEMTDSATLKSRPPNSACTGASVEMITPGGEVEFLTRIIDESMLPENRTKIQWFSGMLGKLSSVGTIVTRLRDPEVNCLNYLVTEFVQGQRTRRWCIAWSWTAMRPPAYLARDIGSGPLKRSLSFPTEFDFDIRMDQSFHSSTTNTSYNGFTTMTAKLAVLIDGEISKLGDMDWSIDHDSRSKGVSNPASKPLNKTNLDGKGAYRSPAQAATKREIARVLGTGVTRIGDSWSRKARRKNQQDHEQSRNKITDEELPDEKGDEEMQDHKNKRETEDEDDDDDDDDDSDEEEEPKYDETIVLAFRISLTYTDPFPMRPPSPVGHTARNPSAKNVVSNLSKTTATTTTPDKLTIRIRWLQGNDSILFESFCGWLKRKVSTSVTSVSTAAAAAASMDK